MPKDYHLTPRDQQRVDELFPLHQAKIHLGFAADIIIDNKKINDGAVGISEHLVIIFKRGLKKALTIAVKIHLFDLESFSTVSDSQCRLRSMLHTVQIKSEAVLRFARVLIRNYISATLLFPPEMRIQFKPHDPSKFPEFHPKMSPSQMFQLCYNAYCSYYETSYEHYIVNYFHNNVSSGNGIFNLNELPLDKIQVNFGDPIDLRPFFGGLMFCPFAYGIVAQNFMRHDIAAAISPLIMGNKAMKIVILKNCGIETGMENIAKAIKKNKTSTVQYWDVSNNNLKDGIAFFEALSKSRGDVFYLDVSNTSTNNDGTDVLIKAIASNKHLWHINYLHLQACPFSKETVNAFNKHLANLGSRHIYAIKSLNIDKIGSQVDTILESIIRNPQPIEKLNIGHNPFKKGTCSILCQYLSKTQKLHDLSLAGASPSVSQLGQLIKAISKNDLIKTFKIDLSSCKLDGKSICQLFGNSNLEKWAFIGLDDNKISVEEFNSIIRLFDKMPNLKRVSLSENFTSKSKGIESSLSELFKIQHITEIVIRGAANCRKPLGHALFNIIKQLEQDTHLESLDISFNLIGDKGLNMLADSLISNTHLREIQVDGSRPKVHESFIKLLDVISENKNIINFDFPIDDIYQFLALFTNKNDRAQIFDFIVSKQLKAQKAIRSNQLSVGLSSNLSLLENPELNELLDTITIQMNNKLSTLNVREHSAIASAFGLPLPHLSPDADQRQGAIANVNDSQRDDTYDLDEANVTVIESAEDDEMGLNTLQFNSLCLRAPELGRKVNESSLLVPTASDFHVDFEGESLEPPPLIDYGKQSNNGKIDPNDNISSSSNSDDNIFVPSSDDSSSD